MNERLPAGPDPLDSKANLSGLGSRLTPQDWRAIWLTEALRQIEIKSGPLADSAAVRLAKAKASSFEDRLCQRALGLAAEAKLDTALQAWFEGRRWIVVIGFLIAATSGAALGSAALLPKPGFEPGTVNLALALGVLIAANLFTMVVWLAAEAMAWLRAGGSGRLVLWPKVWLGLGSGLGFRTPHAQAQLALSSALASHLSGKHLMPVFAGLFSHGFWAVASFFAIAMLSLQFSFSRYEFAWQTTILDLGHLQALVAGLSAPLTWLSTTLPDPAAVASAAGGAVSGSENAAERPADLSTANTRATWAFWLIAVTAVWGLAPRLLAFAYCAIRLRQGLVTWRLDPSASGYAGLRDRLVPESSGQRVIDPPPDEQTDALPEFRVRPQATANTPMMGVPQPQLVAAAGSKPKHELAKRQETLEGRWIVFRYEWPEDCEWPPQAWSKVWHPELTQDGGPLDSREDRQRAFDALARDNFQGACIVFDARRSPDRGVLGLLAELAQLVPALRLSLITADVPSRQEEERYSYWQEALTKAGVALDCVEALPQCYLRAEADPAKAADIRSVESSPSPL